MRFFNVLVHFYFVANLAIAFNINPVNTPNVPKIMQNPASIVNGMEK